MKGGHASKASDVFSFAVVMCVAWPFERLPPVQAAHCLCFGSLLQRLPSQAIVLMLICCASV